MLRARQKLGKYRIERRIARGGFADVYRAYDTVEGVPVAIKVPHPHLMTPKALGDFRREARLAARLDHPNILPVKTALFIEKRFVIVYPLGEETLEERLRRRISVKTALELTEQMLRALAFAHRKHVIHCDVKPDNLILFPGNRLRLTDFGIAKVAFRTLQAAGTGTIGYVAPEQAMGKPSLRSDVFSAGLVLYRLLSGRLPEWPYKWPFPGLDRVREKVRSEMVEFLRKSLEVDPHKRFDHAGQMLNVFLRLKPRALKAWSTRRNRRSGRRPGPDWRAVLRRQFVRRYGRELETRHTCRSCGWPVSEPMQFCPWCGVRRRTHRGETRFPAGCPRCRRGLKLDWKYCPWCYGGAVGPHSTRTYTDVRYQGRCANARCDRRQLMPFMKYCPWCRKKVEKPWRLPDTRDRCPRCRWGVTTEFWEWCPWCGRRLETR